MARLTLAGGKLDEYGDKLPLARLFTGEIIEGLKVVPTTPASTSVVVQPGSGFFRKGADAGRWGYPFLLDTAAGESVAAPTAQSQPMIVQIVAALDESLIGASNTNNPNSWKLYAVGGTPNASPVVPTVAQIQAAIGGASRPYVILGDFRHDASTAANGVTAIADRRLMVCTATVLKKCSETKTVTVLATSYAVYETISLLVGSSSNFKVTIETIAMNGNSGATRHFNYLLSVDGVEVKSALLAIWFLSGANNPQTFDLSTVVSLSPGEHTITFSAKANEGGAVVMGTRLLTVEAIA